MGQCGSVPALTDNEKRLLSESWDEVKKNSKRNGVAIFVELFRQHPSYQQMFPAFADVPLEKLSTNPKLVGHALGVVFSISAIMASIDDNDVAEGMVAKQVTNHIPRNVTLDHYKNAQTAIATVLQPLFSREATQAWLRAFECFNAIAEQCFD